MPALFFGVLFKRFLKPFAALAIKCAKPNRNRGALGCFFAQVQYAANARRAISAGGEGKGFFASRRFDSCRGRESA